MDTKSKVSLPYRLLTLLLAIILTITCVPDLTAFAGDNGGGNSGGAYGAGNGFYTGDSGYRFYILDENGKMLYSPVDVKNSWIGPNSPLDTTYANITRLGNNKSTPKVVRLTKLNSKYTGKNAKFNFTSDLWDPLDTTGQAWVYGDDFRDWMMAKNSAGFQNMKLVVLRLWGSAAYKELLSRKMYLIVEPIVRMGIPADNYGNSMSARFEGTWYGYMKTCAKSKYNVNGGTNSGWGMTAFKCALANGMELVSDENKDDLGLIKPTYEHNSGTNYYDIGNQGWGIHIYWNQIKSSGDPISTYDIDNNPKKPETTEKPKNTDKIKNDDKSAGRKDGEVEIVKLYGYAYKRKDWTSTTRRFVKVEQTDNRLNGDNKSITGYFLRKKTTDKICKH